jgi:AhpD family alkylhydroperoxidase
MTTTAAHVPSSPHGRQVLDELSPLHRQLRRAVPEVYAGFGELHRSAFAPGALDTRTKELIAMAIAVVEGCDGCIASHAQNAAKAGATRQGRPRRSGSRSSCTAARRPSTARAPTTRSASSPPRRRKRPRPRADRSPI